jgi:sporulation protein YlmC with PRC-barrel domain
MRTASLILLTAAAIVTGAHAEEITLPGARPGAQGDVKPGGARASMVIGSKVYSGDTVIGSIEDVVFDLDRGSVLAVIVSVGGFIGIGEKLIALQPGQVRAGSEARFTADLTKEQIAAAPAFER